MMEKHNLNKNSNPFSVPENYFENLNERILRNTGSVPSGTGKTFTAMLRPYFSLAAIIAGAALLTLAVVRLTTGFQKHGAPGEEMYADIPQFLIDGMDMYLIEHELFGEAASELPHQPQEKEEIIEYLMLNEVDMSLIYELIDDSPTL